MRSCEPLAYCLFGSPCATASRLRSARNLKWLTAITFSMSTRHRSALVGPAHRAQCRADATCLAESNCCSIQYLGMRAFSSSKGAAELGSALAVLQAATRVLTGVALRSLEALDGAVTLPQFRMLAVLADLGRVRSTQVARALGLEPSTVTRLADRL